jgi:hypothetical protein
MNTKLPPSSEIGGCVFDAYGTLFDVNSAARLTRGILGDKWQDVAELWRTKQLQRFVSFHPMVGTHILLRLSGSTWCGATGLARCPNESRQLLMRKLKRYQSFRSWLERDNESAIFLQNGEHRLLSAVSWSA